MRKGKKIFACLFTSIGVLMLPLALIKGSPAAFIVATGSALIAYGIISFLFEHYVHKIGRVKIMDEDERNILINGKAYTLVTELTNMGFIILALYSAIHNADMLGCTIAIGIFLLSHVAYIICFKYFDIH